MMKTYQFSRTLLLSTAALLGGHSAASAQTVDNAADATATESSGVAGDIIVTATRRAESTLSVPLSIAALDTESLIKSNIKNVADIARTVPGLSFNEDEAQLPGGGQSGLTIRGVSSPVGEPTSGTYLDETALTGLLFSAATYIGNLQPAGFDFDRIEVLRGPQGTLFGAGAMGGAVRFIQKKPSLTEVSGRAVGELGVIQDGGITGEVGLAAGAPLVDGKLGIRVSAWQRWKGGFIDRFDPITGEVADGNSNRVETRVGSAALTWAPVDEFRITPSIFYQTRKIPHIGGIHEPISDLENHEYQNGSALASPLRDKFWIPSLTIEGDLGFADLVSVTSLMRRNLYSEQDITTSFGVRLPIIWGEPDGFGNPIHPAFPLKLSQVAPQTTELKVRTFSQEVRLASSDPSAPLRWTVGGYYQKSTQYNRVIWPLMEPGDPKVFGGFPFDEVFDVTQEQIAGFAQVDFEVVDGLTLTAGGRIQQVKVSLEQIDLTAPVPTPNYSEGKASPFIPKLGVEYQIDPDHMVYASAGKGFRSGGVNPPLANVPGCNDVNDPTYNPDSLWSYEIGTKNRLLDNTLTFAASAFHIKWKDIQTQVYIQACGAGPTVNAGSAEINGFDASISFTPVPALRADFAVAYNDAKFTESVFDDFVGGPRPVARDGDDISHTIAPWTLTAALEYTVPFGSNEAYFRAEDSYRSRAKGPFIFQDPAAQSYSPTTRADPGYNLLNLRAGVRIDEDIDVALFMTNALNAQPLLGRTNFINGSDFFFSGTITPRTTGVNVNVNF